MPKSDGQKSRILEVRSLLLEKTDAEHGLSVKDIISHLNESGINADRRAIYSDIELLSDSGIDIEKFEAGKNTDYRVMSREFELAELKLLSDAVCSAKFLTPKKSNTLIKKLSALCGENEGKKIRRDIYMAGKNENANPQVYYTLDAIQSAMEDNKQITFLYFEYNEKKEKIYRHGGKKYKVSPWGVIFSDGNYYMVAYDSDFSGMKHYRIDKMEKANETDELRNGRKLGENLDMSEYANKIFGMFGGESTLVTMRAENRLSGIVIDRFGKDVTFIGDGDSHFKFSVNVSVSPQFLGWIMSFGKSLTIVSPEKVVKEYKAIADEILHT